MIILELSECFENLEFKRPLQSPWQRNYWTVFSLILNIYKSSLCWNHHKGILKNISTWSKILLPPSSTVSGKVHRTNNTMNSNWLISQRNLKIFLRPRLLTLMWMAVIHCLETMLVVSKFHTLNTKNKNGKTRLLARPALITDSALSLKNLAMYFSKSIF